MSVQYHTCIIYLPAACRRPLVSCGPPSMLPVALPEQHSFVAHSARGSRGSIIGHIWIIMTSDHYYSDRKFAYTQTHTHTHTHTCIKRASFSCSAPILCCSNTLLSSSRVLSSALRAASCATLSVAALALRSSDSSLHTQIQVSVFVLVGETEKHNRVSIQNNTVKKQETNWVCLFSIQHTSVHYYTVP